MMAEIIIAALASFNVHLIVWAVRADPAYELRIRRLRRAPLLNFNKLIRRLPKHTLL